MHKRARGSPALDARPAGDRGAPAPPASVRGVVVSGGYGPPSVALEWEAAADNLGVYSYTVYQDGRAIGTTRVARPGHPEEALFLLNFVATNVEAGRTYLYEVRATDFAGNVSPPSTPVAVTVP